jgi:sec-independent protein translocase protein TatC
MDAGKRATLIDHLSELRSRFLRSLAYITFGAIAAWLAYDRLYTFLLRPIRVPLEKAGGELAVRSLLEGFLLKCEIAAVGGLVLAAPLIYWEVWSFVTPGLTRRERGATRFLVPLSAVLFLAGVGLAYAITVPSVTWLLHYLPPKTLALISLNETVLLILKFYLAFGLSFQLPIVLIVLAGLGIVNSRLLCSRWREATIGIFVIAAIITPTWDPITMTICALPMSVLYLGTIAAIRIIEMRRRKRVAFGNAEATTSAS